MKPAQAVFSLQRVWVIQDRCTGEFLGYDGGSVRSLKQAGRDYTPEGAHETAEMAGWENVELHTFYERVLSDGTSDGVIESMPDRFACETEGGNE